MSYSLSFQLKGLPNCQMSKFEVWINWVIPEPIESDLVDNINLESKMSDFFLQTSHFDTW